MGLVDLTCGAKCEWKKLDLDFLIKIHFKPTSQTLCTIKVLTDKPISHEALNWLGLLLTDLHQVLT
jgi:hypothetical protein